jgi:hypothetical protein
MELTLAEIRIELEVMRLHPPQTDAERQWFTNLILGAGRLRLWELVDAGVFEGVGEDGEPLAPARVFRVSELPAGATMANIAVALGVLPSLSQARKSSWNRPLEMGAQTLTKKRIRINIVP